MKLNNKGVVYLWTVLLFVGATVGLFKTVIHLDEKEHRAERTLKIEPEDRLIRSGQFLTEDEVKKAKELNEISLSS